MSEVKVITLIKEALNLAKTAVHFDINYNYSGACDYYDKSILTIDEIMKELPNNSDEWVYFINLRTKYDERLELLRYFLISQVSTGSILTPTVINNNETNKKKNIDFIETDIDNYKLENIPEVNIEIPYWLLRNIKQTMTTGGFITKDIFVIKDIWQQNDLKFSGINTKITAFEIIIKLIATNIDTLYISEDEDSLSLAEIAFVNIYNELYHLQNHLSKPFPYIKELKNIRINNSSSQIIEDESQVSVSTNSNTTINNSTSTIISNNNNQTSTTSNTTANSSTSNNSKTLSQYVFNWSKNVRKYAEVSYQRLAVALPTKLTFEELEQYKTLVIKLCDKCQILNTWTKFILKTKSNIKYKSQSIKNSNINTITDHNNITSIIDSSEKNNSVEDSNKQKMTSLIDSLYHIVTLISAAIRDILVEILLRDLQYLLEKYLNDSRKAFTRMNWDDELEISYQDI